MRKLFILFFLLWAGSASAETVYYICGQPSTTNGGSASGVCMGAVPNGYRFVRVDGLTCIGNIIGSTYEGGYASVCTTDKPPCGDGYIRNKDGSCGTNCTDTNTMFRRFNYAAGATGGYTAPTSYGGCAITPGEMTSCRDDGAGGKNCWWTFKRTGSTYTGPAPVAGSGASPESTSTTQQESMSPTSSPPIKQPAGTMACPSGSVQGGVDSSGIPICVGSGTNPVGAGGVGTPTDARPVSTSEIKSTDASGNKITTRTETRDNSDGSKTTTRTVETEAPDGSKTSGKTTTTGTRPDGRQGVDDKPDNDLCRQHPDLTICKNSSVAGTCGQTSCMGDAIQCATLREAAIMECRQKQADDELKASSQYTLGQQVAAGNDPLKDSYPTVSNAQVVDVPSLSADAWLGGGAGFADVTFTFQGKTFVIPFSKVMPYLLALRYALMAVAALMSFRILSGAVMGA